MLSINSISAIASATLALSAAKQPCRPASPDITPAVALARTVGGMRTALAGNSLVNNNDPTGAIELIEHGRSMMPSWKGQLSAGDIAAVVTFIRTAWGNRGGAVSEQDVMDAK